MINGKSPEHIKEMFKGFETQEKPREEIKSSNTDHFRQAEKMVAPNAVSSKALDNLFGLKALEADEKRFGKLAGGCF